MLIISFFVLFLFQTHIHSSMSDHCTQSHSVSNTYWKSPNEDILGWSLGFSFPFSVPENCINSTNRWNAHWNAFVVWKSHNCFAFKVRLSTSWRNEVMNMCVCSECHLVSSGRKNSWTWCYLWGFFKHAYSTELVFYKSAQI